MALKHYYVSDGLLRDVEPALLEEIRQRIEHSLERALGPGCGFSSWGKDLDSAGKWRSRWWIVDGCTADDEMRPCFGDHVPALPKPSGPTFTG